MPKRPSARQKGLAVENAVAEAALGQRAQTRHRAGLRARRCVSSSVMCVAWIRHQRSSIPASRRAAIAPAARRALATQSSTSLVCSAAWICTGPAANDRGDLAQLLRRDRAQRMRRDADSRIPAAIATISRERAISVTKAVGRIDEAELSGIGRGAAEAAIGIEAWQQRQADAGRGARRGDARRHLADIGIGPRRRYRDAGNGIRRPVVKPASSIST